MHCLGGTDAEDNAQNFRMGYSLSELWVKARPALLNSSKVKTRRIGDCLDVVLGNQVVIVAGNCWMLTHRQTGDCLIESITEIGILVTYPIAREPAGIHGELHKVRESADLLAPVALLLGRYETDRG